MEINLSKYLLTIVAVGSFLVVSTSVAVAAESQNVVEEENLYDTDAGIPDDFENMENIDQVISEIDSFYMRNENPFLRAAAGTKWAEGQKVWDGEVGYWVTSYFWVKGSDMSPYFVVGQAQRKAVIAKYGSVNNKTSYKMKTKQHITLKGKWSYKTVSASAVCYGR